MDIEYLKSEILPKREQEIREGKNLSTRQPIYVVLDLQENFCSGHSDYSPMTNYKDIDCKHGYLDDSFDSEEQEFCETDEGMFNPIEVTRFYTDRIIAFFLTSEAAHDYLRYQEHNLTGGYVYVFYSGYANIQMDELLKNDKPLSSFNDSTEMLTLFEKYGWVIKSGSEQIYGSPSDIYAEQYIDGLLYYMKIDDGNFVN